MKNSVDIEQNNMQEKVALVLIDLIAESNYNELSMVNTIYAYLKVKNILTTLYISTNEEERQYTVHNCLTHNEEVFIFYMQFNNVENVLDAACKIKRNHSNSDVNIILCGPGCEVDFLRFPYVDYTVSLEETAIYSLIHHLYGFIPFTSCTDAACVQEGKITHNTFASPTTGFSLDELPFQDREVYNKYPTSAIQIYGQRGCSGKCSFCMTPHLTEGIQFRSGKSIVDEIEYIVKTYNKFDFDFIDDNFIEIDYQKGCEKIEDFITELNYRRLRITFSIYLRVKTITDPRARAYIHALFDVGLESIFVGLESGNQEDLNLYAKGVTIEQNAYAIDFLRNNKIYANYGFIMFNPFSTIERLMDNIDFLEKYQLAYDFYKLSNKLIIYPYSRMRNMVQESGLERRVGNTIQYRFLHPIMDDITELLDSIKSSFPTQAFWDTILYNIHSLSKRESVNSIKSVKSLLVETMDIITEINANNSSFLRTMLTNKSYYHTTSTIQKEHIARTTQLISHIKNNHVKLSYYAHKLLSKEQNCES